MANFTGQKYISLETYKKTGEPVRTPVWFAMENDKLYFHTSHKTWKVKRIKQNPEVRVAPSTWGGKPKGEWVKGVAKLVEGEEAKRIFKLINSRYGLNGRIIIFFEKLFQGQRLVFSVRLGS